MTTLIIDGSKTEEGVGTGIYGQQTKVLVPVIQRDTTMFQV